MEGKIALEEHYESPDFDATGDPRAEAARNGKEYFEHVKARLHDPELYLADMDAHGLEYSVVSLTQPGVEAILDRRQAIDVAQRMNDYVAQTYVNAYPDRFGAWATVPLQDPEAAAEELERAVTQLGFKGANVNGYTQIGDVEDAQYLDEPAVDPFWAKVSALNVPVYLHPRDPLPSQQRSYQGYGGLLGSAWGFGVETATHALRLMLSGLFDRYPNLTVILGHLGESLPYTLPRIDHRLGYQVRESQGPHNKPLTQYLRENFYITTSGHFHTPALIDAILTLGSDRILFSTDYPYEKVSDATDWFDTCPISELDRSKIGRGNAVTLFNL